MEGLLQTHYRGEDEDNYENRQSLHPYPDCGATDVKMYSL